MNTLYFAVKIQGYLYEINLLYGCYWYNLKAIIQSITYNIVVWRISLKYRLGLNKLHLL